VNQTPATTPGPRAAAAYAAALEELAGLHDHFGELLATRASQPGGWGAAGELRAALRGLAEATAVLGGGEPEAYLEAASENRREAEAG
jgi:hypothetical protein